MEIAPMQSCQSTLRHKGVACVICIALFLAQAGALDFYLVNHLSIDYLAWLVADFINLVLLVTSTFRPTLKIPPKGGNGHHRTFSISWFTWLSISINASVKIVLIIHKNAMELEKDPSFFGPNTFKTAVALGSCIFLLLLITQHDAPRRSAEWKYIDDLTDTVVFDILDTVDILDVFFNCDDRDSLWDGLEEIILAQSVLNLVLPTVPLVTLCCTGFGKTRISKHLVYIHRLLVVLVVNVPNLVTRFVLWHGVSVGISPFVLKNIILICLALSEFYEQRKEELKDAKNKKNKSQIKCNHIGTQIDLSPEDSVDQQSNTSASADPENDSVSSDSEYTVSDGTHSTPL
ncbi:uncharacterized protein LOC131930559 [Physella acuta]|uniref:uncharacterized protein LOC131930559 n=1 Tax=Physella acuta TaxID=109671 RepID=UPI0027DC6139|nr:uncharacterized protein LOC131930559 [Physella acuta]